MILTNEAELSKIAIHRVGSKHLDEEIIFSECELKVNDSVRDLLSTYFLSPFKTSEYFNLHHETDLQMNEVYNYCTQIFQNTDNLFEQSVNLAKHLYENSDHSKINGGEFYVTYIKSCKLNGEPCDAIGIFKSETKDTFLKIYPDDTEFKVDADFGVNINKLDKGCLIFNKDQDEGYVVSVVDKLGKSTAVFWKDKFLKVVERNDSFTNTRNMIDMCSAFIKNEIPKNYEIDRPDQIDLLNKTVNFIDDNDRFMFDEYANKVLNGSEAVQLLEDFKQEYENAREIEIDDNFRLSPEAKKKAKTIMKSILKLDKNFHIYIHGDRNMIEKGTDEEKGMNYYKVYYHSEN